MKRWILTIQDNKYQPKIYAQTADEAVNFFKGENIVDVQPYTDMSYLEIIKQVQERSELLATQNIPQNRIREWYRCQLQDGILRFRLYKDNNDGLYYDITEYQLMSNDSLIYPITFVYSNPTDLFDLFFSSSLACEVESYRFYGQPKLDKPKELTGIKQSFSVQWGKNCTCQCFVKDNDLWIKHRDFFSASHKPLPEDDGTPLTYRLKKYFDVSKSYLDKFIYPDCWGDIILRNEAWIVFRNMKQTIQRNRFLVNSMSKAFIDSDVLIKFRIKKLTEDWRFFFESVIREYINYQSRL